MLPYHCEQCKISYSCFTHIRKHKRYTYSRAVENKYVCVGTSLKTSREKANTPPDFNKNLAKLTLAKELAAQVTLATNGTVDLIINSPSCRDILQTAAQPLLGLPSAINGERYSLIDTKLNLPSPSPLFRARWIRKQLTVCPASPPSVTIAKCCG